MVAWLTVKYVAIFFGLATTAFCVSTIVLAVQKADLENELQDALDKIEVLTELTTTTSTTTTTTTTTANPNTSDGGSSPTSPISPDPTTPDDGSGSTPGSSSTSTTSGSTSTGLNPIYPTLPTGLPDPEEIEWRLPTELTPIKYRLYFEPNLNTGACEGTVSIQFQAMNATNLIVLHAKDLEVHSISILNMMARMRIAIDEWYLDDTRELLMIKLREVLSLSKAYTLSASFDCKLESLTGAYLSEYTTSDGSKQPAREFLITRMEEKCAEFTDI